MGYVSTTRRYRGLSGSGQTATQAVGIASGIGVPVAAPAISSAIGAGAALGSLAVPIVGAALAGITIAITALIKNSGCGPTCIQATAYANQAEPLLQRNLAAYVALPAPRAITAQQAYLANFDAIWQKLQQMSTSDPTIAGTTAGKDLIADRQQGACKWKAKAGQWNGATWVPWGAKGSGSDCFNWFTGYRDPIANDPNVVSDSQAVPASGGSALSLGGGSSLLPWALGAAAVIAAVVVLK